MRPIPDLWLAVAKWKLGGLWGEELANIAARALEDGFESSALAELAGLDAPTMRDAEPLLRDAMRQLKIPEPDPLAAGFTLATHFASLIHTGKSTPYEGARHIWQDVYDARIAECESRIRDLAAALLNEPRPEH